VQQDDGSGELRNVHNASDVRASKGDEPGRSESMNSGDLLDPGAGTGLVARGTSAALMFANAPPAADVTPEAQLDEVRR
jgi:hypothetical protein